MDICESMRKGRAAVILVVLLWWTSLPVRAQDSPQDPLGSRGRLETDRKAMMVLSGWAVANVASGIPLWLASDGSIEAFGQMNAAWNAVNLVIATGGLAGALTRPPELTLEDAVAAQRRIESVLLLNVGLDVAYMTAGALLLTAGHYEDDDRLRGYGTSLLTQGGFLFVFDLAYYMAQARNRPRLTSSPSPTASARPEAVR
jgi:hypothetical protein